MNLRNISHTLVVEPQEYDRYAAVIDQRAKLLVTPHRDEGVVVTRNFIWEYAKSLGVKKYWTMDDNIQGFYRLWRNTKFPFGDGTFLRCMEDFAARYENIPIVGMQYEFFAPRRNIFPALNFNLRVYSNMLIETDVTDPRGKPYRWEGLYNEDTDLCLRMFKDGLCTVLFNAFLANKIATMRVSGGNMPNYQPDESLKKEDDGRWKMAEELRKKHPDVTTITRKWGRWQHHVDYSRFKNNKPILHAGVTVPDGTDNYGMKLKKKS